jgi:hypothetical protein
MTNGGERKPWLEGIIDTLVGARFLLQSAIPHRNRLAVILLDSAFETGCRTYLRNVAKVKLEEAHKHRDNLMKLVQAKLSGIDTDVWNSLDYYYDEIRNDFYHVSASKTLTESAVLDYEETVQFILDKAFSAKMKDIVETRIKSAVHTESPIPDSQQEVNWGKTLTRTERILAAVAAISPRKVDEVNSYLKKQGIALRINANDFTNTVARNTGSRNLFFFDRDQKRWGLSALGKFKLASLLKETSND